MTDYKSKDPQKNQKNPEKKITRAFIAIDIPAEWKNLIGEIQTQFNSLDLHANWVKPENIHLTLKFLGEVSDFQIDTIRNFLHQGLQSSVPCSLGLGPLGLFPHEKKPRVFWIGVEDTSKHLTQLNLWIEKKLQGIGFLREKKKFSPHLTLARIKSMQGKEQLLKTINSWKALKSKPFLASEVKLYKSQLTIKGSRYTILDTFALGN